MVTSYHFRKTWLAFLLLLIGPGISFSGEWVIEKPGQSLIQSFDQFEGTYASLPTGFSVCVINGSLTTSRDEDFGGIHEGGTIAGGCYAWQIASNDYAMGCQPTTDKFTPGFFEVYVSNGTSRAIPGITISYEVVCLNNAGRSSRLDFMYSVDGVKWIIVTTLAYVSPVDSDLAPAWVRCPRQARICFPDELPPNRYLQLRWYCDDSAGSGSRDEYGIDNVSISFHPPPPQGTVMSIL